MIIHLFNSSSVSGPEKLVIPALAKHPGEFMVVNLLEERIKKLRAVDPLEGYCRGLDLKYRSISVKSRWDGPAINELRALLRSAAPALVHAHDVKASVYLLRARGTGVSGRFPIVSTHHGVHGRPDWKTRLLERVYRRRFLNAFDRALCVSTPDHQFLLGSGVKADRLRLHLNGSDGRRVDAAVRDEESRKARAAWFPGGRGPVEHFVFGVVGRLSPEKDHARMLRSLSHLIELAPHEPWKCLIFGEGPLKESLQKESARLGLARRVLWMGHRSEVGREMAGFDLLLSFSKAEGLPINLIEAGWAGTPVMATKVGGVRDLLPDEEHGTWVLPEEPPWNTAHRMRALLSASGREKLCRQASRFQERIEENFTGERWLQRLSEVYAELGAPLGIADAPPRRTEGARVAVPI